MILIGDSAWPLKQYPKTWNGQPIRGWAVYVGGDTPHPWTDAEIAALKLVPWFEFIVPIWVRSNPTGSAQAQQDAAAQLAWSRRHGQPPQTVIELDFETAVEGAYAVTFDTDLQRGAELEMLYGSAATVTGNPAPSDGYNEADWTGVEPTALPPGVVGEQFYSQTYDLTAYAEAAHLWSFRPQTTTTPTTAPSSMEDDEMSTTSNDGGRAGLSWPKGTKHVVQVNYAAANQPDLVLAIELKLKPSGPVYPAAWSIDHTIGTDAWEIPAQYVADCVGVILNWAASSPRLPYDLCAA